MNMNEINIWNVPFYLALYIIKYILAFCFYLVIINSSFELGKSKYYKIDPSFVFM